MNPPGITYNPEYEPDMEKMVKALKILHEAPIPEKKKSEDEELQEGA
ncbi:hypothetical protein [Paenibacillus azoreducens]|uniref:Uncharacterized protein n=1 Tax=Paenibacillus azoreducens TaxID=116718 RepID=A0A920CR93_9BACL|nr:hypothetical protein [Paenibacillus azoreducens]GIO48025.1 hypothetical protein J34TS1_27900 [Paenibacillus azoreducens]